VLRYASLVEAWGEFSIAGDGGAWCGEVVRTETCGVSMPALAVRTFTQAGAPVRGLGFTAAVAHA
jgi:hypothetical protein